MNMDTFKIVFSFSVLLGAMGGEALQRIIQEMAALDRVAYPHQVKCFIDAYVTGKVSVDRDLVCFDDYDNPTIAYAVPHSKTMQFLRALTPARATEIDKKHKETFSRLHENPAQELSVQEIIAMHEYSLVSFEYNHDLKAEEWYDGVHLSDLKPIRFSREYYQEAFKRRTHAQPADTVDETLKEKVFFCAHAMQLKKLYAAAREKI